MRKAEFFGGKAFLFVILQNTRKKEKTHTSLLEEGQSYTHPVKHTMSFDPTTILFPMEEHNSLPDDEVTARSSTAAMLSKACQRSRRKQKGGNKKIQNTPECRKISSAHFLSFHVQEGEFGLGSKALSKCRGAESAPLVSRLQSARRARLELTGQRRRVDASG
jgi:hypothetical protein